MGPVGARVVTKWAGCATDVTSGCAVARKPLASDSAQGQGVGPHGAGVFGHMPRVGGDGLVHFSQAWRSDARPQPSSSQWLHGSIEERLSPAQRAANLAHDHKSHTSQRVPRTPERRHSHAPLLCPVERDPIGAIGSGGVLVRS